MKGRVGFNQAKSRWSFDLSISFLSGLLSRLRAEKNPKGFHVALFRKVFHRNVVFRFAPFTSSGSEVSFFGFVMSGSRESRGKLGVIWKIGRRVVVLDSAELSCVFVDWCIFVCGLLDSSNFAWIGVEVEFDFKVLRDLVAEEV